MVRDAGFEPACKSRIHQGSRATDSQIHSQSFRDNPELAEILGAWPDLPEALKAAVLGIVRSVGTGNGIGSPPLKRARTKVKSRTVEEGA
jgi:hypothetical protein